MAFDALLALWNDIAREREPEYDRWHTHEHVPERVAVRGIRGARRYMHRGRATHRYFTLYELDSLDVLQSSEYRDLVDHPTPWSASMRHDFSHFVRVPCRVERAAGIGIGAAIAVLGFRRPDETAPGVDALLALPGVTAVRIAVAAHPEAVPAWRGADVAFAAPFERLLLIETLDRASAEAALGVAREIVPDASPPGEFSADVYDLAFAFPGHDAAQRTRSRRAGWDATATEAPVAPEPPSGA